MTHDINRLTGQELTHTLSQDSAERNEIPLCEGCLDYFPKALAEIAKFSKFGNDKHNPGEPLHWSREKSTDHHNKIAKHLLDRGTLDPESGFLHDVALAWRALANLEVTLERMRGLPPSRGSTTVTYARDRNGVRNESLEEMRPRFIEQGRADVPTQIRPCTEPGCVICKPGEIERAVLAFTETK